MACWLLALVVGALLSTVAPVALFGLGLIVLVLARFGVGLLEGLPFGAALAQMVALFACAQVGYGIGLGLLALFRARNGAAASVAEDQRGLQPLRDTLLK